MSAPDGIVLASVFCMDRWDRAADSCRMGSTLSLQEFSVHAHLSVGGMVAGVRGLDPCVWHGVHAQHQCRRVSRFADELAKLLGVLVAVAAVGMLFLWLPSRSEAAARKKALADYDAISPANRLAMLSVIDSAARTGAFRLMYRAASGKEVADSLARIGGHPLAGSDEAWPTVEGVPGQFLLQVALADVSGAAWANRLIAVYLMQESLRVKSYACASDLVVKTAPANAAQIAMQPLKSLALPVALPAYRDGDEPLGGDALIERTPGLGDMLAKLTTQPARVVSLLISGGASGTVETEDAILVGGKPVLLQGPHEPHCDVCQQPMRFLLQFGDVTQDAQLGDGGVGYVYGCDAHPAHCQGFADC